MWNFILNTALPVLGTFCLGIFGWLVTHFVGRQILEFYKLRRSIHETLLQSRRFGKKDFGTERYYNIINQIDLLSTKLIALFSSASPITRLYFKAFRYNLTNASVGLIQLSLKVGDFEYSIVFRYDVEKALRLPLSSPEDVVDMTRDALRQQQQEELNR